MIFKKDSVSTLLPTLPDLLISDVLPGTGKIKSALPAQTIGSKTQMVDAFPLLTNAPPMLRMVTVPLVSRDTILWKELVSTLLITPLNLLI